MLCFLQPQTLKYTYKDRSQLVMHKGDRVGCSLLPLVLMLLQLLLASFLPSSKEARRLPPLPLRHRPCRRQPTFVLLLHAELLLLLLLPLVVVVAPLAPVVLSVVLLVLLLVVLVAPKMLRWWKRTVYPPLFPPPPPSSASAVVAAAAAAAAPVAAAAAAAAARIAAAAPVGVPIDAVGGRRVRVPAGDGS